MVPAQGVRLHENQREQREDRERDHLLDDFQFPDRERPAELRRPDAVGRNLEAVFEQGDAPAEQYDGQYAEAFELGFECDVAVPGERHESVRQDEQGDGGDSFEHMPYGIKTAQKYQFFPYDMHVLQKNAIRDVFHRDGDRVSGVRCVWVRPAAGSIRMPCDRRCCRFAAARSSPGWGGAEPVDDDCRAPGRRSRRNCGRSVRPVARVISGMRRGR